MAEIRNDEGFVTSFTLPGLQETMDFDLPTVAIQGARSVKGDRDCKETYDKGNDIAEVLKQNLIKTFECMNDTSRTLQETDEQASKNSIGVGSWAGRIGMK